MNGSTLEMIVRLVISLAIVVGMIWLLVKLLALRSRWLYRHRPLKVLGGVGLGPQKSVQLVEIGETLYVLGVGQDVRLLHIIEDPEERERIIQDFTSNEKEMKLPWLERFRRGKPYPSEEEEDFTTLLAHKLDELKMKREQRLGEWSDSRERPAERKLKD